MVLTRNIGREVDTGKDDKPNDGGAKQDKKDGPSIDTDRDDLSNNTTVVATVAT